MGNGLSGGSGPAPHRGFLKRERHEPHEKKWYPPPSALQIRKIFVYFVSFLVSQTVKKAGAQSERDFSTILLVFLIEALFDGRK